MKIIDAHAHIFERLSGFGRRGELRALGNGKGRWATGEEMQVIPPELGDREFTPETLLSVMDKHEVEKAVLLQGNLYGFQNEYVKEAVDKYPDRFVGACTFDPYCLNAGDILTNFIDDLNFRILKFELSSGAGFMGYHSGFRIDGAHMEKIWGKASENGIPVVLDIGSPGMISFQVDAIKNIVQRYPDVKIVICHLFAPTLKDEKTLIDSLNTLKCNNVWYDISALPWNVKPEPYPYPTALRYLKQAKNIVGSDHLLWGSDIPAILTLISYQKLIDFVVDSGILTDSELEALFRKNAALVYGL